MNMIKHCLFFSNKNLLKTETVGGNRFSPIRFGGRTIYQKTRLHIWSLGMELKIFVFLAKNMRFVLFISIILLLSRFFGISFTTKTRHFQGCLRVWFRVHKVRGHPCKLGKLAIFYLAKKIKKFTFSIVYIVVKKGGQNHPPPPK